MFISSEVVYAYDERTNKFVYLWRCQKFEDYQQLINAINEYIGRQVLKTTVTYCNPECNCNESFNK